MGAAHAQGGEQPAAGRIEGAVLQLEDLAAEAGVLGDRQGEAGIVSMNERLFHCILHAAESGAEDGKR